MNYKFFCLVLLVCFGAYGCASDGRTDKAAQENQMSMHDHMHHAMDANISVDSDFPIFQPAEKTFTNHINMLAAENVYLRYNTAMKNRKLLEKFYTEMPEQHGWQLDAERSKDGKIAMSKGGRYVSVRIFEMKQGDSTTLAYSINLVKPKHGDVISEEDRIQEHEHEGMEMEHAHEGGHEQHHL